MDEWLEELLVFPKMGKRKLDQMFLAQGFPGLGCGKDLWLSPPASVLEMAKVKLCAEDVWSGRLRSRKVAFI
jgi:hypothetical protein